MRISIILELQASVPELTGRELAALLKVHESTVSRYLKFIALVRRQWREMMSSAPAGFQDVQMMPQNFSWIRDGRDWQFTFKWRNGVRVQ
jgi:hypothetical protein